MVSKEPKKKVVFTGLGFEMRARAPQARAYLLLGLGIITGGGLMQIFLAAPLFNESECEFNEKVAEDLREAGFDV